MITLRRATERHHDQSGRQEGWLTFCPSKREAPFTEGFGLLSGLDEHRLPPGSSIPRHAHRDVAIITYVHEGALVCETSPGRSGVVEAGEFQRLRVGRHAPASGTNASQTEWAHVFRLVLRSPLLGLEPNHQQKRFSMAERRGGLCLVASPDARKGSLRIDQNASIYSCLLAPGYHVGYGLTAGRGAWIHVLQGGLTLANVVLSVGDGVGVTAERAVSMTAREETEFLLVDIGDLPRFDTSDDRPEDERSAPPTPLPSFRQPTQVLRRLRHESCFERRPT